MLRKSIENVYSLIEKATNVKDNTINAARDAEHYAGAAYKASCALSNIVDAERRIAEVGTDKPAAE